MKYIAAFLLLVTIASSYSQQEDEQAVRDVIDSFFKGFHQRDSTLLKKAVSDDVILQTIARDPQGGIYVKTEDFSKFVNSIVHVPDSVVFREELKTYSVLLDGAMANAWTPYEFWHNETFSHCGVNSFQLFNDGTQWKIIYLIDTRRLENCP